MMAFTKKLLKIISDWRILALLPFIFLTVVSFPAVASIIQPGYFPMHDDLQVMRQLQIDKCIKDGQIPCRWVPDMGYGFGYPLFNYYPPLPYYTGEVVHLLGISFLDTIKVLFVLAIVLSGFAMYIFASEFFGKLAGLVAAAFYIYAPYHAVDVYVRGAMNESWALVFFPVILWSIYKLIKTGKNIFIPILGLSTAFLALSHLPTLMVFAPGAVAWAVFWWWREKSLSSFPKLMLAGIFGFGLSAFFILPVVVEQNLVHTETLFIGYFNYLAHFLNLNQLFVAINWGYGESVFGPADTMSFAIGYLHWIVTIVALIPAFLLRKKNPTISLVILFFFFWTAGFTFLTHQRAAPIWEIVKPLALLQFPWRMLALTMVATSFLAAAIFSLLQNTKRELKFLLAGGLTLAVVILNFQFFTWREFYPQMTDEEKFSGKLWQLQQTAGIFDYLPKQLPLPPADPPDGDAKFIKGVGSFVTEKKQSNLQVYNVEVNSQSAEFQINTFYFPGWKVLVNSRQVSIDPYRDTVNGTMIIDLSKGKHQIVAKFSETPVRLISDIISAVSWFTLLGIIGYFLFQKIKFKRS